MSSYIPIYIMIAGFAAVACSIAILFGISAIMQCIATEICCPDNDILYDPTDEDLIAFTGKTENTFSKTTLSDDTIIHINHDTQYDLIEFTNIKTILSNV